MASQKQIDANRRNAQHSTGPRTPTGKARSRCNGLRDGLTGQIITLSDQDRPVFEQLKAELVASFDPQTPMERKLAQAMAWDTWRLDHLRAVEMNIYTLGAEEDAERSDGTEGGETDSADLDELDIALSDARTFRSEAKRFELMSLYETRMNRGLHRNLAILRDLQAERKRNYERDKKDEILIARLHEFNDMPIKASTAPSKNGFTFSDEEIAVGAARQRYVDTAAYVLKNNPPANLHGALGVGCGDSFLRKVADRRPLSQEERNEIHKVPLETLVMQRLNHPEEFGVRQPL
jgi:hypothetical protein